MSDGFERVHWLVEQAWHGDELADGFRYAVMTETGFVDRPMFCLQEFAYGGPQTGPTAWAAQRALTQHPEFDPTADPLLFTGEMMYPWMFAEIRGLRPFQGAVELLAKRPRWPELYDLDRLAANDVPVAAAVYFDDMYVDAGLSLATAAEVGNVRTWVTSEHEHDGLRTAGNAVLTHLMEMAAGLR